MTEHYIDYMTWVCQNVLCVQHTNKVGLDHGEAKVGARSVHTIKKNRTHRNFFFGGLGKRIHLQSKHLQAMSLVSLTQNTHNVLYMHAEKLHKYIDPPAKEFCETEEPRKPLLGFD